MHTQSTIVSPCKQCGTSAYASPSGARNGRGQFCSKTCYDAYQRRNRNERECVVCGATFYPRNEQLAKGGGKYCSVACRADGKAAPPNHVCETCGIAFHAKPAQLGRFCSNRCRGVAEATPGRIPDEERDLIYMAGLIDGEGTITADPSNVHPLIVMSNTHLGTMEWVHMTFGGRLSARAPRKANHKVIHTWYLGSTPAIDLCQRLLPYLKIKWRQAEILIALGELPRGRWQVTESTSEERMPLLQELGNLNYRGVHVV